MDKGGWAAVAELVQQVSVILQHLSLFSSAISPMLGVEDKGRLFVEALFVATSPMV